MGDKVVDAKAVYINQVYDQIVRKIETYLVDRLPVIAPRYEAEVVRQRVVQLIVAASRDAFAALCAERLSGGHDLPRSDHGELQIGSVSVDLSSGRVDLAPRLITVSIARFAYHWLRLLFAILNGIRGAKRGEAATLVFGLGMKPIAYRDSDARFVRFCRQGPVEPLAQAERLVIEDPNVRGSVSHSDVVYTRSPIAHMLRHGKLGSRRRFGLLCSHLLIPFRLAGSILQNPIVALLAADIASTKAVRALDACGLLQSIVISNANFASQPLWLRGPRDRQFRVHLVWSSQNCRAFQYMDYGPTAENAAFRHIRTDEHWVWSAEFKRYLEGLPVPGTIRVVGPITWYLPEPSLPRNHNEIRIAVFDVTPASDSAAIRAGFVPNYYSTQNMLQFIDDIVTVSRALESRIGKPVRLLLKHKRAFTKNHHDSRYVDRIRVLSETNERFDLVAYDENLYALLPSCDISIAVPYTSTVHISAQLKLHTVYFDATGTLILAHHERERYIHFASGKAQLAAILEESLGTLAHGQLSQLQAAAYRS